MNCSMTKAEFYKSGIELHKKCGQGISGIVKLGSDPNIATYIDELIKEGLLKACDTGGSMGHPESNIFYMPTKGYNVWEDEGTDGQYNRHKGRYLQFVRFYLGALVDEHEEGASDTKRFLNPSMMDVIRNSEAMTAYAEWLKRNEKALEEMLSLDDFYAEKEISFTDEEINKVKTRGWFEKNLTVNECLKASTEAIDTNAERISLNKQLINLYKSDKTKYSTELKKSEEDIAEDIKDTEFRKAKLNRWLSTQDKKAKIQDVFNF